MTNKYVKKYKKIVNELIRKSFPELKGKKVKIIEYNFTKTYGGFVPIINWLGIHKRSRKISRKELEALLVHELCHMEDFSKKGFFKTLLGTLLPVFPRKELEYKIDKMVIEKGYAKPRALLVKRLGTKSYMSEDEIKSYAKKIGKWQ